MRAEDRALAGREPEIPGLGLLLDDAAFAAALREALPDAGVQDARGVYLRYKPGTNCVVLFEVRTTSGVQLVHARAERPDETEKLRKFAGGSVLLEGSAVAALAFPTDRELPALPRLARRREGISVLAYKPGRRLVARSGNAVLKAYAPERYAVARAAAAALARDLGLPIQRLRRWDDRRALLKFRWEEGRPLDALIEPGGATAAWPEVATALAALNAAAPAGPLPRRSAAHEAGALAAAAGAAGVAGPAVERAARALAARLAGRLPSSPAAIVHGDFSCDQVVMGARGATLLDLDEAALGDPAQDLGSALADLELRVLDGRLGADAAGELAETLRAGRPSPRVRLWTAAGLLRRAAEPFRRRRPGWDAVVEAVVERAAALAGPAPRRRTADPLAALESVELPGAGAAVLRRAWPRSGRLLLEYVGAGGLVVGAQWSPDAAFAREPAPATVAGGILVHVAGADRRLPGLRELLTRPGAELLSHRPTRRAAVALPGSFVKAVRPERAARVAQALRAATALAGGAFAVPAVQEVDPVAGTVACAPLPGRPLGELLAAPDAAAALGKAVRALHERRPPHGVVRHDAGGEAALVVRFAHELAPWAPDTARAAAAAARTVAARLATLPAVEPAPLHRDLHDKQVLVDPRGGVGLLDFDTLAAGDPALDVGNLLAHLELRALQGPCTPDEARGAAAAFLAGYEATTELEERAAVYAAAARVRLTCVYALRPAWRGLGGALLPESTHLAGTASSG